MFKTLLEFGTCQANLFCHVLPTSVDANLILLAAQARHVGEHPWLLSCFYTPRQVGYQILSLQNRFRIWPRLAASTTAALIQATAVFAWINAMTS